MESTLSPYLNFNGNCADAMKFYQSVFGGELDMSSYGDTPGMVTDKHQIHWMVNISAS
jgi:PhnB protein